MTPRQTLKFSICRRRFLQSFGTTALSSAVVGGMYLVGTGKALAAVNHSASQVDLPTPPNNSLYLASSVKTSKTGHQLLSLSGEQPRLKRSGWRGHQALASPDGRFLVSVARRPDTQLLIEDLHSGQNLFIDADEGRHYYGHGLFTPDGRWFYTPENDYENVRGVIGKYDVAAGFIKVAEWDSHGVGPHQIAFLPQQNDEHPVMVVANGGIETHPDYPRIKLNIETMRPNLSYLDAKGKLLDQVEPPHFQLSLRHLDVAPDGQVWVGAQYQGEIFESPNLIFSHRMGEALQTVQAPTELWSQLNGYIASLSCHKIQDTVCITAPRANTVTFWQRSTGKLIRTQTLSDCSGACSHPQLPLYYISSGAGDLAAFNAENGNKIWQQRFEGIHWDNHLTWTGRLQEQIES